MGSRLGPDTRAEGRGAHAGGFSLGQEEEVLLKNQVRLLATGKLKSRRQLLVERKGSLFKILAFQEDGGPLSQRPSPHS